MKEYKLNENEHNYLISIVANTKRKYFTKEFRRNEIAKFESLDNFQELETYSEMDQIENKFYMDELLRIAKPYLTRKEMNTLKKAIDNADNFKEFKSYLKKHQNYEYKILSKVLKKIGGIINV